MFDLPQRYSVDTKGSHDISIVITGIFCAYLGSEKTCFILALCVLLNGFKVVPMIIFKQKTVSKNMLPGIVVKANERGWMNKKVM